MTQNYKFVEIPQDLPQKRPLADFHDRHKASLHNRYGNDLISGKLELLLKVQTPLTVGSGLMLLGSDLASSFKNTKQANKLEKKGLIQTAINSNHRLVIPGSTLKGAIRSIYETLTNSCLCKLKKTTKKRGDKKEKKSYIEPDFLECKVKIGPNPRKSNLIVCPSCRIFGAMGYSGLVHFSDAPCDRTGFGLSTMPTLNSPDENARDPDGVSVYFDEECTVNNRKGEKISDKRFRGRKFYPHLKEATKKGNTSVQVARPGYTFSTKIHFANLSEAEVGTLLISLGLDQDYPFALKIGGGKAIGKGTVTVEVRDINFLRSPKDRYLQYGLSDSVDQITSDIEKIILDFINIAHQNEQLVKMQQLKQISEIMQWLDNQ